MEKQSRLNTPISGSAVNSQVSDPRAAPAHPPSYDDGMARGVPGPSSQQQQQQPYPPPNPQGYPETPYDQSYPHQQQQQQQQGPYPPYAQAPPYPLAYQTPPQQQPRQQGPHDQGSGSQGAYQQGAYHQAPPPPHQQQYQPNQQQQTSTASGRPEPIHIHLVNPMRVSSGFTQAVPARLQSLARTPISTDKWAEFIREVNGVLSKSPGSVANGVASFWLVSTVTLGLSHQICGKYEDRIQGKAMEIVELYNRSEFASWGIVVRMRVDGGHAASDSDSDHDHHYDGAARARRQARRRARRENHHAGDARRSTLVMVVEQS